MTKDKIIIRECETIEDLTACTHLQREVFALPDIEISPVRHLVVTKHAGGFTLGAFAEGKLVGFVLSVPAFFGSENFFYSHMTAVSSEFQSHGIGAKLKWAQREKALTENIKLIRWTFPARASAKRFFQSRKTGRNCPPIQTEFLRHGLFDFRQTGRKNRTRQRPSFCRMEFGG